MLPIRLAKLSDASDIIEIYGPIVRDTTTSFETEVPTVSEIQNRITKYMEKGPWLVITEGTKVIGYAYACEHRARSAYQWSIELSVYIHEDYRGQGLASRLYLCAIEILHQQGYCTILAGITQPNNPSNAFHQSIGFKELGHYHNVGHKHGKWCDVKWFELSLNKLMQAPKPIIMLNTLSDSGRLEQILAYHNSPQAVENQ